MFGAHQQLAKAFFNNCKILSNVQFESVDWISVHHTLHNLPWLFQVWAAKQVLGIAGTIKNWYTKTIGPRSAQVALNAQRHAST